MDEVIRTGDRVRLIAVPSELIGVPEDTRKVFELCVGKEFTVDGFNPYGHAELNVGDLVDQLVGGVGNTLWVEVKYLEKI